LTSSITPARILAANGLSSPAAGTDVPAPVSTFTTEGIAPRLQFEAWAQQMVPYLDLGTTPPGLARGFAARGAMLRFGPFLLYSARLPAYGYARGAARIRRDGLDHWMVAMCRRGTQRQSSGDTAIVFCHGVPHVISMGVPFVAEREGDVVDWVALHVARDAVPELEADLSAALYRPLDSAAGLLLGGFLGGLADALEGLRAADVPHLAGATQALLAAALRPAGDAGAPAVERLQLARLKRLVRENLGAATLRPSRLASMAGMSRSQLYRQFEPFGGVAQFIQRERLRQARRLLADPSERRDIASLAEAVGFFDASSFSRAFRREFGCTPREARMLAPGALMNGAEAAAPRRGPLALLRDL
jgi:AraC-like DNA-binding protein